MPQDPNGIDDVGVGSGLSPDAPETAIHNVITRLCATAGMAATEATTSGSDDARVTQRRVTPRRSATWCGTSIRSRNVEGDADRKGGKTVHTAEARALAEFIDGNALFAGKVEIMEAAALIKDAGSFAKARVVDFSLARPPETRSTVLRNVHSHHRLQ